MISLANFKGMQKAKTADMPVQGQMSPGRGPNFHGQLIHGPGGGRPPAVTVDMIGQMQPKPEVGVTQGLFGDIMKGAGDYASMDLNKLKEARTPGMNLNPFQKGIDFGGYASSPFASALKGQIGDLKRGFFGDSGVGGLFGQQGSGLAKRGLLSSGAMQRMAQTTGQDFQRGANEAMRKSITDYGTFKGQDLNRLLSGMTSNMSMRSGERTGDLNRLLSGMGANQNARNSAIDRSLGLKSNMFDRFMGIDEKERDWQRQLEMMPFELLQGLATGTPTVGSSSGSSHRGIIPGLLG